MGKKVLGLLWSFFWFPAIVFVSYVCLLFYFEAYRYVPQLDIPAHYIGGIAIGYSIVKIIYFLEDQKKIAKLELFVFLFLVFGMIETVTVLWEFAEYLLNWFWGKKRDLSDTIKDLFFGMLGGLSLVFYLWRTKQINASG